MQYLKHLPDQFRFLDHSFCKVWSDYSWRVKGVPQMLEAGIGSNNKAKH